MSRIIKDIDITDWDSKGSSALIATVAFIGIGLCLVIGYSAKGVRWAYRNCARPRVGCEEVFNMRTGKTNLACGPIFSCRFPF